MRRIVSLRWTQRFFAYAPPFTFAVFGGDFAETALESASSCGARPIQYPVTSAAAMIRMTRKTIRWFRIHASSLRSMRGSLAQPPSLHVFTPFDSSFDEVPLK
jgi:hypothetical protein